MLKVEKIVNTCNACPSQWEGVLEDGREIYCRYRWGWLCVDVAGATVFKIQLDQGDSDEEANLHYEEIRKSWSSDVAERLIESDKTLRSFSKEHGCSHSYAGFLDYAGLKEALKEMFQLPEDEG